MKKINEQLIQQPSSPRWVYQKELNNSVQDVPELSMLGNDHVRHALPLETHQHQGSFEFVFIEKGTVVWEVEGESYETQAGDIFHTQPGEMHRGRFDVIEPCKIWWIIIDAPNREGWLRLSKLEFKEMKKVMWDLPRIIHTGVSAVDIFKRLKKAILRKHLTRGIEVRIYILELLILLLFPDPNQVIAEDIRERILILMKKIEDQPEWRPSVADMAFDVGVSPSHFYRIFQQYSGYTPLHYLERVRIEEAYRRLKKTEQSITSIAHDLGYKSSQHFATVFKRFSGISPSQYKKMP